jgi:abortive infection bacteriophage resistance protein
MNQNKELFSKTALTLDEQINLLQSRGLIIENIDLAKEYLKNISYYRMSAYWYTFLKYPQQNHQFKENINFNVVAETYRFDRDLRLLIFNEIERIEVALRSKLIYHYCHNHGNNWFEDASLFNKPSYHYKFLNLLSKEVSNSSEEFIKHYNKKYINNQLPPAWMSFELISFGQLSLLFRNLKNNITKKTICAEFGLDERILHSWFESIAYIRNASAHHMRLWNRKLPKTCLNPKFTSYKWIAKNPKAGYENRLFLPLAAINYLIKSFHPNNNFVTHIKNIKNKFPNIPFGYMGFPIDWQLDEFWKI